MKIFTKVLTILFLATAMLFLMGCLWTSQDNGVGNGKPAVEEAEIVEDTHEYVDLGLPSGTLWATCNIGAETPEGNGDYFAWGETGPKTRYSVDTYKHCIVDPNAKYMDIEVEAGPTPRNHNNIYTKYCNNAQLGYDGFTDDLTVLEPNDDAATVNWGKNWCMPTNEQWAELFHCSKATKVTQNEVYGLLLTGPNGKEMFLPIAGLYDYDSYEEDELLLEGDLAYYWSRSLCLSWPAVAWRVYIYSAHQNVETGDREVGCPIRAVRSTVNVDTSDPGYGKVKGAMDTHYYVDLGLPSGTSWAYCNLGAENPEEIGTYFAWGETEIKYIFDWETYKYCNLEENELTKYCNDPDYGYNGFTDELVDLQPKDDAALFHWGEGWHVPTQEQWDELCQNTESVWGSYQGVLGRQFTGPNGNAIFIPAGGYFWQTSPNRAGKYGYYWANSINERSASDAAAFIFSSDNVNAKHSYYDRSGGRLIRPVYVGESE